MDYVKPIVEAFATIFCIIGVIYGTIPRRIGLWYLIVGTILWIVFSVLWNHWFLFLEEVFLLILNIISLKTWKKAGIRF